MRRKIIVDPHRDGATIWFDDNTVKTFKGDCYEIAQRIYNFATIKVVNSDTGEYKIKQAVDIAVDIAGLGRVLYEMLINMGLKVIEIKINMIPFLGEQQEVIEYDDESYKIDCNLDEVFGNKRRVF